MTTRVHRRTEGVTGKKVIELFDSALTAASYETSDIEALSNEYAKSPTDNFIVHDKADLIRPLNQGDIYLRNEASDFFKAVKDSFSQLKATDKMNLQDGDSLTGDHTIRTLPGTKVKIQNLMFTPIDDLLEGRKYPGKLIEIDKPFLLTHKEHGNMAFPEGTYLAFHAIDADTLERVYD